MKFKFKTTIKIYLLLLGLAFTSCSKDAEVFEEQVETKEKSTTSLSARGFAPANYFTAPTNATRVNFTGRTSADLNRLIRSNSKVNGVIISIPRGNYTWNNIDLKSNVHLEIASGTVIKHGATRGPVFKMGSGKNGNRLKNISIRGNGGRFTIDMCGAEFTNKFVSAVNIGRVDNFRIGDFNIKDRRSILNSILMQHVAGAAERRPGSKDGVVENISQTGAHTGYGLVQTYNCTNVLFKNLECEGGITLRLETDDRGMKDDIKSGNKEGGVRDIFAVDIRNKDGLATFMMSPHFVQNGNVTLRDVVATSTGFAVRSEVGSVAIFDSSRAFPLTNAGRTSFTNFVRNQFPGFTGNPFIGNAFKRNNGTQWAGNLSPTILNRTNRSQYIKNQIGDLKGGSFGNVRVSKATAIYGTNARIKQNQLKYIPCNRWNQLKDPGSNLGLFTGFEYHGPSVGLSIGTGFTISNQTFSNFPNGFTRNIDDNTAAQCNNAPNTIRKVTVGYPSCN